MEAQPDLPAVKGGKVRPSKESGATVPFHVTAQFVADGSKASGTWSDPDIALSKFREWAETYASRGQGTVVTLARETADGLEILRTWPPTNDGTNC